MQGIDAEVVLADRFSTGSNDAYHIPVYDAFLKNLGGPSPALERALNVAQHSELTIVPELVEELQSLEDEYFDVVFSNSVLEHVLDFGKAASEMARVTRPGGCRSTRSIFVAIAPSRSRSSS